MYVGGKSNTGKPLFQTQFDAEIADQARKETEQDEKLRALAEDRAHLIEKMRIEREEIEKMHMEVNALLKKKNDLNGYEACEIHDYSAEEKWDKDHQSQEFILRSDQKTKLVEAQPSNVGKDSSQSRKELEHLEIVKTLNESGAFLKEEIEESSNELEKIQCKVDKKLGSKKMNQSSSAITKGSLSNTVEDEDTAEGYCTIF